MFEMNENLTRKHSVNVVFCIPPKRATWATGTMNTYFYRQRVVALIVRRSNGYIFLQTTGNFKWRGATTGSCNSAVQITAKNLRRWDRKSYNYYLLTNLRDGHAYCTAAGYTPTNTKNCEYVVVIQYKYKISI